MSRSRGRTGTLVAGWIFRSVPHVSFWGVGTGKETRPTENRLAQQHLQVLGGEVAEHAAVGGDDRVGQVAFAAL